MDSTTAFQVLKSTDIDKLHELITVFEMVFEMKDLNRPHNRHLQRLLEKDNFLAIVALNNHKVIGGLTMYVLDQYYTEKPLAYIYDLAVLTEYQRKGIGKKIIDFTKEYCRLQGFEEVFVQAEKVDDYAVDFYRLTKPTTEMQVVHFLYALNRRGLEY
jgi:aminoglycoside 3-N-acetyltransferase I